MTINQHKSIILFVALLAMLTACTKENETGDNTPSTPETHGRMYDTRWQTTYDDHSIMDEGYYQDHYYVYRCTDVIHFSNNNSGTRHIDKEVYDLIAQETTGEHADSTIRFTYVYKGGDSQYGPGVLYWENGDSNKFYVQNIGGERIYVEDLERPDYNPPCFYLVP